MRASELPRLLTQQSRSTTAAVTCVLPWEISSHFISIQKSALESSSLWELGPRGQGDASRGALEPACSGMRTRGSCPAAGGTGRCWHTGLQAPQPHTHWCPCWCGRGQGAALPATLTEGNQSHPFTQKPIRVRRHAPALLQRASHLRSAGEARIDWMEPFFPKSNFV